MLLELGLSLGITCMCKITADTICEYISGKHKIKKKFESIVESIGIKNKNGDSFYIKEIYFKNYGYLAVINIPYGLSLDHLKSKKNIIEDNLNSVITLDKNKFKNYITMRVVTKDISKFKYTPVNQNVNQLYLGKDITGKDFLLNLDHNPMLLIAGSTGQGKTCLLSCILTNLIYNCANQSEIYFIQLIKSELSSFNYCSNVKFNANTVEELTHVIKKIKAKIDERSKLFETNGIRNINQWNKKYRNKYMKRVFLVCEEFSQLADMEEQVKGLWDIVKTGRSVGIHFIGVLQRTTADNLDTSIKSQMTKLTFHQNSSINSQNVINSDNAIALKQGECIILDEEGETKLKVPFIDDDLMVLKEYVKSIRTPSKEYRKPIQQIKEQEKEKVKEINSIKVEYKKENRKRKGVINIKEIQNVNR